MPCFRLFTNVELSKETQIAFLKEMSVFLAKELRKPECYVTVSIIPGQTILWGGEDVPCAQAYLMSLGGLQPLVNCKISYKLSELLKKYMKITPDHYYLHFLDTEGQNIGYDCDTF